MQLLVEYGLGGLALVLGGWVVLVGGYSVRAMFKSVKAMRMKAEALEEFRSDQDDDHKNGNGKVA